MRVTILGSGTSIPTADRGPPGVLVRAAGRTILVDLGPGILRRLPAEGVGLETIDVVLFTHYHPDHCADLAPLLFALRSPRYEGRGELRIVGPSGLRELHEGLEGIWGSWMRPTTFLWSLEETGPGAAFDLGGGVAGRTVAVDHTPVSLAWRIEEAGAIAAISGDTGPGEGAVEAGRDADLFVLECAFPDGMESPHHLTPTEAGRVATEAGCRRLCLTHFYPVCEGADVEEQCRATWDGPLSLARDGLAFDVRPGGSEEAS